MSLLLSIILIIVFSLVPLLLWGYGSIFLSEHIWNRARFFAGIFGGGISVGCIYLFRHGLQGDGFSQILAVLGVFLILGGLTTIVIQKGSPYIRGFLRKILLLHIALFCILLLVWGFFRDMVSFGTISFLAGMSGFFVAASLEEGVKHVSSVGLTAKDFRFSRVDFLLFTFFVTLGFVLGENLLYLIEAAKTSSLTVLTTGVYRVFFALPLHVFAASICVLCWWKALSYGVFSWRYILLFISGYFGAALVHSLYNYLIDIRSFTFLLVFAAVAYIVFTQSILPEEEHSSIS